MPPNLSPLPCIGPESVASQYTERPYSVFAECRFTLAQNPPPLLPPPQRCTTTLFTASTVEAAPSVAAPPGIENPPVPVPYGE